MRRRLPALLCLIGGFVTALANQASADITVVPSSSGEIGAWLAAGPLFGSERNLRFTTQPVAGARQVELHLGATVVHGRSWSLLSTSTGRFDLRTRLRASSTSAFALLGAVLEAQAQERLLLWLGVDDGVTVVLDGRTVYERDVWRPPLHDDDAVAFTVSPGRHALLIRLRQRDGAWGFRARLLDADNLLPPRHVRFVLPGVAPAQADTLAAEMIDVQLGLSLNESGYAPTVAVRAPGGLPAGVSLPLEAEAVWQPAAKAATTQQLFRVAFGALQAAGTEVGEVHAQLPRVEASILGDREALGTLRLSATVGSTSVQVSRRLHPQVRACVARIDAVLDDPHRLPLDAAREPDVIASTLRLERERLSGFLSSGDNDLDATVHEASEVTRVLDDLAQGRDPLRSHTGPMRLAYPSPLDGKPRPFGLYVPPSFLTEPGKPRPLVVVLHGLNGLPMQMLRIFFGGDHPWHRAPWEDRHVGELPPLDAFVLAPSGFGNLSYREAGERDVMHLVDWAERSFPVDRQRVYVSGLSMGGTGAAAIGLRHADRFAAAQPLCGYHSYSLRRDMAGRKLRSWEQALASFWSNVSWADNGRNLPLHIVHGKQDAPVENSGVLIDRYRALGYSVVSEHPDTGHNVWQRTYERFKGYRWLAQHKRDPEPGEVVLRTPSLRYAQNAWVHVLALREHLAWGRIRARVVDRHRIDVQTDGVEAFRLERAASKIDVDGPVEVRLDGTSFQLRPDVEIAFTKSRDAWKPGSPDLTGLRKRASLSGPIHDAFLEPLVFVVGTQDPSQTRVNYEVAAALATPPYGVEARWPIVADGDVDETMERDHALFLVGAARSNAYVARIADRLPIRVETEAVILGGQRVTGEDLGALFIYPNPRSPERYVVVLAGVNAQGTLRALSLPRLLPDYVVYDAGIAGARGQMVLGNAFVRAGGMFDAQWQLAPAPWEGRSAD